jgi:hypothetical protein
MSTHLVCAGFHFPDWTLDKNTTTYDDTAPREDKSIGLIRQVR